MSSYTCISCRVAFSDGEVQRAHYKTDWHRYNLKRKVAEMPPVTAENFQERVLSQRAAAEELSNPGGVEGCTTCNKKFSSANAYQNHIQSHKHQQAEKQAVLAAQRKVEKMNEKNLEKGMEGEKLDNNSKNEALQQALREQQQRSGLRQAGAQDRTRTGPGQDPGQDRTGPGQDRTSVEKAPRLQWFAEQARKMGEVDETALDDDAWEDVEDDDDDDMEEEDDEEETMEHGETPSRSDPPSAPGSIPLTDCLFCSFHSHSMHKNLAHMTRVHSFFLPDVEFIVDLRGLLCYLGEKVGVGNVCLWCNEKGRSFYSTEAVQAHMTDKSHCKLFTDGDAALEFADFYDFRSSYPDQEGEEDEEDVPDEKSLGVDDDTLELTLPSGAKVGHRSLLRYYKQRFGTPRTLAVARNQNAVGRVLRQYRALGWGGDGGRYSVRHQPKDMRYVQRMKSKWMLKTGMSNNSTKQTHFRLQVMF